MTRFANLGLASAPSLPEQPANLPKPPSSPGSLPLFHLGSLDVATDLASRKDGDLFVCDRLPDRKALEFQSLYSGDVARYRRWTDVALGPRSGGGGQAIAFNDGRSRRPEAGNNERQRKSHRYFAPALTSPAAGPNTLTGRLLPAGSPLPPERLFIPLALTVADGSGTSEAGETFEEAALRRTAEFNRRLRETPADVALWRAFVAFQEVAVPASEGAGGTRRAEAALAERQLAIYERAVKMNPDDEVLLAEHLDLCRRRLELTGVEAQWKQTLFKHPVSPRLWHEALAFHTSEISVFKVPKSLALYHKALETFAAVHSGTFATRSAVSPSEADSAQLDLLEQSCRFQRLAGYTEKALGCFQAAVEFAAFGPGQAPAVGRALQRSEVVALFEDFWESQVARIGDQGATGFAAWCEARRLGGTVAVAGTSTAAAFGPRPPDDPAGGQLVGLAPWEQWLQLEVWRDGAHWQPWRPAPGTDETDDDCDDPDRVVVVDDVAGHLLDLGSEDARLELTLRFLEFAGAPVRRRAPSDASVTCNAAVGLDAAGGFFLPLYRMVRREFERHTKSVNKAGGSEIGTARAPTAAQPFGNADAGADRRVWGFEAAASEAPPPPVPPQSASRGCGAGGWFPSPPGSAASDPSRQRFIAAALEAAVARFPRCTKLRLTAIDHAEAESAKAARKLCKSMLKLPEHRNDLLLLDRYAQLEAVAGNYTVACKVYETALAAAEGLPPAAAIDAWTLCRHFTELHIDNGNQGAAIQAVCARSIVASTAAIPAGSKPAPSVAVVQARHTMRRLACHALANGVTAAVVDLAACWCWLEYLTAGMSDAAKASEECAEAASNSTAQGPLALFELERLAEDRVHLALYHRDRGVAAAAGARAAITTGLASHPYNPFLLTAFIATEQRSRVSGRVRAYFNEAFRAQPRSPIPALFAVVGELLQGHSGAVHRVRSLFQRAADDRVARRCPLLWRMMLEFERAQPTRNAAAAATAVFYRAVQNCPGAKCVYLDGVAKLPSLLREALDIVMEKELHLRSPLEELELMEEEEELLQRRRRDDEEAEQERREAEAKMALEEEECAERRITAELIAGKGATEVPQRSLAELVAANNEGEGGLPDYESESGDER